MRTPVKLRHHLKKPYFGRVLQKFSSTLLAYLPDRSPGSGFQLLYAHKSANEKKMGTKVLRIVQICNCGLLKVNTKKKNDFFPLVLQISVVSTSLSQSVLKVAHTRIAVCMKVPPIIPLQMPCQERHDHMSMPLELNIRWTEN